MDSNTQNFRATFSSAGKYFVEVDSRSSAATFSLTIQPIDVPDDFSAIPSDSTPTITTDAPVRGRAEVWNDTDVWAFDATENEVFTFESKQVTLNGSSILSVLNEAGDKAAGMTYSTGDRETTSHWWRAEATGRYFIAVRNLRAIGTYDLSIDSVLDSHPDSYLADPLTIVPGPLDLPLILDGQIDATFDIDMFQFDAVAGQIFHARPMNSSFDALAIKFLDPKLNTTLSDLWTWQAPEDGTYYLQLSSRNLRDIGDYYAPPTRMTTQTRSPTNRASCR